MSYEGKAIVCHGPLTDGGWKMEDVIVREPRKGELLVEMVASGICHTEPLIGGLPDGTPPIGFYPRVLGHEGSGYVKEVGPGVDVAQPGDPVLLSFAFCRECETCKAGHLSHCESFNEINMGGPHPDYSFKSHGGEPNISGRFFGQSSFAKLALVRDCSVVNVKGIINNKEDLQFFAPLGCGIQTGSGSTINAAKAGPDDVVCVMGLGGVGLSAVMGAKIQGCRKIIGVDKFEGRLNLAKELGATHVVNASRLPEGQQLSDAVKECAEGVGATVTIDASGAPSLIQASVDCTRNRGKILQVGSAPLDFNLEVNSWLFMLAGKQYMGAVQGHSNPQEYLPKLVQWYNEGKLPIDRLIKIFPAAEFPKALEEMHSGSTIKPVLIW